MSTYQSVAELTSWGILEVQGHDARKFLQGQLTQDLNSINHTANLACHLTAKGRVIANFILLSPKADCYWLLMPKDIIDKMILCLKKYALFSKVAICDRSADISLFMLWQDNANNLAWQQIEKEDVIYIQIADSPIGLALCPNELAQAFRSQINPAASWQHALITLGIPMIDLKLSELFTVHDLNLLSAVSFNKGCYTGQEIVARMHYKAKLKHHLYTIPLSHALAENTVFLDEHQHKIGHLINIAPADKGFVALIWLQDDIADIVI
jgi:folate-binding protein YgfZ